MVQTNDPYAGANPYEQTYLDSNGEQKVDSEFEKTLDFPQQKEDVQHQLPE